MDENFFTQGGITVAFTERFVITGANAVDAKIREEHLNAVLDSDELRRISKFSFISQKVMITGALKLPADGTHKQYSSALPTEKQIEFATNIGLTIPEGIGKHGISFLLEKFTAAKRALVEIWEMTRGVRPIDDGISKVDIERLACRLAEDPRLSMRILLLEQIRPPVMFPDPESLECQFPDLFGRFTDENNHKCSLMREIEQILKSEWGAKRLSKSFPTSQSTGCLGVIALGALFILSALVIPRLTQPLLGTLVVTGR